MVILIVLPSMKSLRKMRHDRLIKVTPLLDGFEHVELDYKDLRRIYRKRQMCALQGHLWEVEALVPSGTDTHPYTYHLVCESCFPHKHSRRIHKTYNLFAISERERD